MTNKFSRFLHLERARDDRAKPQEQPQLQSGNRFETLAQRGEGPQEAAVPETHLERFRGEAPLALAEEPTEDEQRFPRCGSCESDNGRFAKECVVCGADLTTPQQRAFNERLWQTRRQELAREREATAALSQQKHEAERQAEQVRFAQMLEKLREQERSSSVLSLLFEDGSFGLKLLGLIPNPVVRWSILALCILVPLGLFLFGRAQAMRAGAIIGGIMLVLFLPSRRRSRWWR